MVKAILVCGGRKFYDKVFVFETLDKICSERGLDLADIRVVTGDATGVDSLAIDWAIDRRCNYKSYQARWQDLSHPDALIKTRRDGRKYDARAGHRRNQRIIDEEKFPILLAVAFPGGSGTADMVKRATASGIEVLKVSPKIEHRTQSEQCELILDDV